MIPARSWLQSSAAALEVMAASRADATAIAALQAKRLDRLLAAARHAPHYARALRGCESDKVPLAALPVSGKTQLMQHFADRVTDARLQLDTLRAFCADAQQIAQPFLGQYTVWESSGSTGQPGLFVQDPQAMAVYDALEAMRRVSPRPLARLLDPFYLGERFAFVGAVGGHFASHVSVLRLQSANPWMGQQSRSFSILQPTALLVSELQAFAPSILATYPTAAVLLADEAAAGRLRIRPQEVWTGGETLSAAMRARIEQAFGCPLRDSYGASEFLPMAWECAQKRLHLNADWVILEAVDARHRPVADGQASHTTLLTNLANHVQPLIRFDIGDSIAYDADPCRCGSAMPTLQVQGRRDDALVDCDDRGRPVTLLPLALTTLLEDGAGVFDFQLQQHAAGRWTLSLGPGTPHGRELRTRCKDLLADFARLQGVGKLHIDTRVAPLLAKGRSGKLRRVVAKTGSGPTIDK